MKYEALQAKVYCILVVQADQKIQDPKQAVSPT